MPELFLLPTFVSSPARITVSYCIESEGHGLGGLWKDKAQDFDTRDLGLCRVFHLLLVSNLLKHLRLGKNHGFKILTYGF